MTRPPKAKAIQRLQRVLDKVPELGDLSTDAPDFQKWRRSTKNAIASAFGEESEHLEEFTNISFRLPLLGANVVGRRFSAPTRTTTDYQRSFSKGLSWSATLLESLIEKIEDYWEDEVDVQGFSSPPRDVHNDSKRVFVVHGRDDGAKDTVARFLGKLGLEPVILHEQADKGRTLIAKFEEEAREVRFAVVLLTPDDEGRHLNIEVDLCPRARQNVIFELGYFAGALGREHVCAMTTGDVDFPTDYDGVVYIPLDNSGGWKLSLVKELKAAGFDVDANLAL